MASFCTFDFAKEYHLLSNQKVFARALQAKTFSPWKGGDIITSLHLSRKLSPERTPAVFGEVIYLGRTEQTYSASSIDWARLASTLTPGPIVEVMVMCLM